MEEDQASTIKKKTLQCFFIFGDKKKKGSLHNLKVGFLSDKHGQGAMAFSHIDEFVIKKYFVFTGGKKHTH